MASVMKSTRGPHFLTSFEAMGDARVAVFAKSCQFIITAGKSECMYVWSSGLYSERYIPFYCHRVCSPIVYLHIREDLSHIFAGHEDGTVGVYNFEPATGEISDNLCFDVAHSQPVTGVKYDEEMQFVLSCSKDKTFACHTTADHKRGWSAGFNSECTALDYDPVNKIAFVALADGHIKMVHYAEDPIIVNVASLAQCGRICSMMWEGVSKKLFTGSHNYNISAFSVELSHPQAPPILRAAESVALITHRSTITALSYSTATSELISVGKSGSIAISDMTAPRSLPPFKSNSLECYSCQRRFDFSFRRLFTLGQTGATKWHCEHCGKAICRDCARLLAYPRMGFERKVTMCRACFSVLRAENRPALEVKFDAGQENIIDAHYNPQRMMLLTLSADQRINVWNLCLLLG